MASLNPKSGVLGFQNAAHLLRRATFCPTETLITQYATYTVSQALDTLFTPYTHDVPEPLANDTGQPWIPTYLNPSPTATTMDESNQYVSLNSWWIRKAEKTISIEAKLSLFLHTIFIAELRESSGGKGFVLDYLALLDFYAKGSIKDFAKKVSRLNAMHIYLDNRYNTKVNPNENYAREFLELFTITKGLQDGTGSYTTYNEQDVQQAAKVLTGFTTISESQRLSYLDPTCHIALGTKNLTNHDTGNKTFSSKFGNQTITGATTSATMDTELDAFIDMIFAQQATAMSYAKRLYRYFVRRTIDVEVETDIITPLAANLVATNYDITSTVKLLLKSEHFYDEDDATAADEVLGAKIKNPLELILQMLSQFQITTPNPTTNTNSTNSFYQYFISSRVSVCGFPLLIPIAVAGYPAIYESPDYDKLWITTTNLKNRYDQFITSLLNGVTYNGVVTKFDVVSFVQNSGVCTNPTNSTTLVNEILELCFVAIPTGVRYTFFTQALLGNLSATNWQNEWNSYISSGNNASVKIALNRFITAVVKSPEYQIS